jgi:ABC-type phosphate transport system permease subunit
MGMAHARLPAFEIDMTGLLQRPAALLRRRAVSLVARWCSIAVVVGLLALLVTPFVGLIGPAALAAADPDVWWRIAQALMVSLVLGFTVLLLAIPLSLGIAIYLADTIHATRLARTILQFAASFATMPSFLASAFVLGYAAITQNGLPNGGQDHSAIIILALLAIAVPRLLLQFYRRLAPAAGEVRDGALALGLTRSQWLVELLLRPVPRSLVAAIIKTGARILTAVAPLLVLGMGLGTPAGDADTPAPLAVLPVTALMGDQPEIAALAALVLVGKVVALVALAMWLEQESLDAR